MGLGSEMWSGINAPVQKLEEPHGTIRLPLSKDVKGKDFF